METQRPIPSAPPPALAAALEQLWQRFFPEIKERLAVLDSAAIAVGEGSLTPQQQQTALVAAHKLAGVLGTFGLSEGTAPARKTEQLYTLEQPPARETASQLAALVAELRSLVEGHKQPHPPAK